MIYTYITIVSPVSPVSILRSSHMEQLQSEARTLMVDKQSFDMLLGPLEVGHGHRDGDETF